MNEKEMCCICNQIELDSDDNRMSDGKGVYQKCYFEVEDW